MWGKGQNERVARAWIVLLALAMVCADGAFAQAGDASGRLSGLVVDAQGGAIRDAAVTLKNESRGILRQTRTDYDGSPALRGPQYGHRSRLLDL